MGIKFLDEKPKIRFLDEPVRQSKIKFLDEEPTFVGRLKEKVAGVLPKFGEAESTSEFITEVAKTAALPISIPAVAAGSVIREIPGVEKVIKKASVGASGAATALARGDIQAGAEAIKEKRPLAKSVGELAERFATGGRELTEKELEDPSVPKQILKRLPRTIGEIFGTLLDPEALPEVLAGAGLFRVPAVAKRTPDIVSKFIVGRAKSKAASKMREAKIPEETIKQFERTVDAKLKSGVPTIKQSRELLDRVNKTSAEQLKPVEPTPIPGKVTPVPAPEQVGGKLIEGPPTPLPVTPPAQPNKPSAKLEVRNLIKERRNEMQVGLLESAAFRNNLKKNLSDVEREAIPFIIEKTDVPAQLNRPDIQSVIQNPSPKVIAEAENIGKYLDEAHEFLVKETGRDVGFINDFVPRLWDIPKNKKSAVVNWFATLKNNPSLKKRVIPTIKEGVEKFGLKPVTTDIEKLIATYDQFKVKTVANEKFAKSLAKIQDETGQKVIQRVDKAPADWKTFDIPALRRALVIPIDKGLLIEKLPIKVHPEIEHEMKVIFQNPIDLAATNALQTVNAFLKKSQLSLSLFHHVALTEVGIPIIGPGKTLKLWNPIKVFDAISNKNFDVFKNMEVSKDAITHRVELGALEDVQRNIITSMLERAERATANVPIVGRFTGAVRSANELWDQVLWDYLHNGLKLNGYETLVLKELKKNPDATPDQVEAIKNEAGQLVNDTFGGQPWELLMVTPQMRQVMQWTLLSPDWTVSTLRQALAPISGLKPIAEKLGMKKIGVGFGKIGLGTSEQTAGFRGRAAATFWVKAGLYYWVTMNLLNYMNTKKQEGKGKWMWENDPGHKTLLFLGFDDKGRKEYMRWGKQFRELPEYFMKPLAKFGGKLSPVIQQAVIQATGVAPSGFKTPLARELEAGKSFTETLPTRLKQAAGSPIPFSLRGAAKSGRISTIAFPVSKGLGSFEGRKFFKEAIEQDNEPRIEEIRRSLLENNIDAKRVFSQAKADITRERNVENRNEAEDRIEELENTGLSLEEISSEIIADETISREVKIQIRRIITGQRLISGQRRRLDINIPERGNR